MKLNFEQIKSITQGASKIEYKNGSTVFFRFNKEEEELYSKTDFFSKTFATAGIQMEFKTDGDVLNMNIKTSSATSRTYFSLDVFVNEVLVTNLKNFDENIKDTDYTLTQFALGNFTKKIELGKGIKKVRLVFPWSVVTELKEIEIENATYAEPVKKEKTIIMYGDSITNGYDALYPSKAYAVQLAHSLNAELFNKAIGGEIFFPQLASIKSDRTPDYITVAYGTNDWGLTEQSDFKKRCESFFESLALNYPTSLIFAITPIWRKNFEEERKFGPFHDVDKIIKSICSEFKNINVISGWNFVPHDEKYFADRRVHPNDSGFEYYFNNLEKEIRKYLNLKGE